MKNIIVIIVAVLLRMNAQSQNISRSVVAAGGNKVTSGTLILSSTIGEVSITKLSGGTLQVTQGFHQGHLTVARIEDESTPATMEYKINVFPNPVIDYVNIEISGTETYNHTLTIVDIAGKVVSTQTLTQNVTQFDFTQLPSGQYIVIVNSEDGLSNENFKVIKK